MAGEYLAVVLRFGESLYRRECAGKDSFREEADGQTKGRHRLFNDIRLEVGPSDIDEVVGVVYISSETGVICGGILEFGPETEAIDL
jgi:hypothetical protein